MIITIAHPTFTSFLHLLTKVFHLGFCNLSISIAFLIISPLHVTLEIFCFFAQRLQAKNLFRGWKKPKEWIPVIL